MRKFNEFQRITHYVSFWCVSVAYLQSLPMFLFSYSRPALTFHNNERYQSNSLSKAVVLLATSQITTNGRTRKRAQILKKLDFNLTGEQRLNIHYLWHFLWHILSVAILLGSTQLLECAQHNTFHVKSILHHYTPLIP